MKKKIIYIKLLVACLTALLLASCNDSRQRDEKLITVSIAPLKYVVQQIVGEDYQIEVLVPSGSSPETYSPTPSQLVDVNNSEFIFTTGLIDFEKELSSKINNKDLKTIELNEGVILIKGSCSHHGIEDVHGHSHGTDPHIWTSPKGLKVIADNAYRHIIESCPDSVKYHNNYLKLLSSLNGADSIVTASVEKYKTDSPAAHDYFLIYHPALTYYAADYGLRQISLEDDGKEPGANHLRGIVSMARRDGITRVFYQKEFSIASVRTIADDIGAVPTEIDPLAEDIIDEILRITDLICGNE